MEYVVFSRSSMGGGRVFYNSKKEEKEEEKKLDKLVHKSEKILFRASSFFPFIFFPDEITIDLEKVSTLIRTFFYSGEVETLEIPDISEVILDSGPFFATLTIKSKNVKVDPIEVKYLKKSDAIKARKIIQGLITVNMEKIDISKIHSKDLVKKLEKIGETEGISEL